MRHRLLLLLLGVSLIAGFGLGSTEAEARRRREAPDYSTQVEEARTHFAVRTALLEKLGREALEIEVSTSNGSVRLRGRVTQPALRALAQETTEKVAGVELVDNQLVVVPPPPPSANAAVFPAPPSPEEANDALLEARIKSRLMELLGPCSFRLSVAAQSGVVSLAGAIPSREEREQAVQATLKVPGVRGLSDVVKVDRDLRNELRSK